MITRVWTGTLIVACCVCVMGLTEAADDKVVAVVNDAKIMDSAVKEGLPKNAFGPTVKYARNVRLDRLIYIALMEQFLAGVGIAVSDEDVQEKVEELKRIPPPTTCACCRYKSLEQYMNVNYYAPSDLHAMIRVNIGFERHVEQIWEKEYPTRESREKLLEESVTDLRADFIKASHIFFNAYQDPDYQSDPKGVFARKRKDAEAVWERIQSGEGFEHAAKKESQDLVTRHLGGALGCIRRDQFGLDFAAAHDALKSGEVSKPMTSPWGVHIIRREEITTEDLQELIKRQFMERKGAFLIEQIRASAKVVKK